VKHTTVTTRYTRYKLQNAVSLSGPAFTFIHLLISSDLLYDSSCHFKSSPDAGKILSTYACDRGVGTGGSGHGPIGGAENAGVENAGVENSGVDSRGGKCRSGKYRSDNVWKAVKQKIKILNIFN